MRTICSGATALTLGFILLTATAAAEPSTGVSRQPGCLPVLHRGADMKAKRGGPAIKHSDGIEALTRPPLLFERPDLGEHSDWMHIGPGQAAVYEYQPQTGTFTPVNQTPPLYTQQMRQAMQLVPAWLRLRVTDNLLRTSASTVARVSEFITTISRAGDAADIMDEVCFLLAWISPEYLGGNPFADIPAMSLDLVADNARMIYANAAELPWVDIVELPDRHMTTLKYTNGDTEETIDPFVYYMFVVHPVLDGEYPVLVNPETGIINVEAPEGLFWRSHLWTAEPRQRGYATHYLLQNPDSITDAEVQNWGSSCSGGLGLCDVDPLRIITADDGTVCLGEWSPDGGVITAITMPVEQAWAAGTSNLLRNLLLYGRGDVRINNSDHVLVLADAAIPGDVDICGVLQQEDVPWCTVIPPADLTETLLADYQKLVVPNGQSSAVFAKLTEQREAIETWVKAGNMLQMHLATLSTDAILPGGVVARAASTFNSDAMVLRGHPVLRDVIMQATSVYDGESRELSGDRPVGEDTSVVSLLGWWVSQNMFDWIGERQAVDPRNVERSVYPVRIARNHYGNCGELQDMLGSASRTALLPSVNVSNSAEDHVWNEFFSGNAWHPHQVTWSDGPTVIDKPSVAMDTLNGGGKEITAVNAWRPDGATFNHTGLYTDTITITVTLTDAGGLPVPGGRVYIATENYYDHSQLTITTAAYTDGDGVAVFTLGDNRNYYIQVHSDLLGTLPAPQQVGLAVSEEQAVAGSTFTLEKSFDASYESCRISDAPDTASRTDVAATVSASVITLQRLPGLFTGAELPFAMPRSTAVQILNAAEYAKYAAGDAAAALATGYLDADGTASDIIIPQTSGDDPLYVVVEPPVRDAMYALVDIVAPAMVDGDADDTEEETADGDIESGDADVQDNPETEQINPLKPDDDGGCATGIPWLLLPATVAAVIRRRKRRL